MSPTSVTCDINTVSNLPSTENQSPIHRYDVTTHRDLWPDQSTENTVHGCQERQQREESPRVHEGEKTTQPVCTY